MSDFGGTGAEAIKNAIDSVFMEEGGRTYTENFLEKLVATTSDGASVNFGHKEGLLKKLIDDGRPWMIKFHCANHRIELAVKDVFSDSAFNEVDKQYLAIFNLLKNSGALKSEVKSAAKALDISCYTLPKITGTRFVSHRRKAYTRFLNMWPALITAFDNAVAHRKMKAETKAKISGLLKVLRNYEFVMLTCAYVDILEKITPLSLVYEKDNLLVTEVKPSLSTTYLELEDIIDTAGNDEELLDSHMAKYRYEEQDGEISLSVNYIKHNHMLRKPVNREYTTIKLEGFTNVGERARQRASDKKKEVSEELIEILKDRFVSFDDPIFDEMKWIEPKYWEETAEKEIDCIMAIADRFQIPLSLTNFDKESAVKEWKRLKNHVKINHEKQLIANEITSVKIWEKLLKYHKQTFPNMCILAELILSLAGSNSAVERVFSMLTTILTNRRLKMSHSTLENLILIRCNDGIWFDYERNEIIQRAADIHLMKQRKLRVDDEETGNKRRRVEDVESDDAEEDESDYSSTEEADFSFDDE